MKPARVTLQNEIITVYLTEFPALKDFSEYIARVYSECTRNPDINCRNVSNTLREDTKKFGIEDFGIGDKNNINPDFIIAGGKSSGISNFYEIRNYHTSQEQLHLLYSELEKRCRE